MADAAEAAPAGEAVQFFGELPAFLLEDEAYQQLRDQRKDVMRKIGEAHEELFAKRPEAKEGVEEAKGETTISREDPPSWEALFEQQQELGTLVEQLKARNRRMAEDKDEYYRTVNQMGAKMDHIEKFIEDKRPLLEAAQKLVAEEKAAEQARVDGMGDDERGAWEASEAARVYLEESEKARKDAEQAEIERWASLTDKERREEEQEKRRIADEEAEAEAERKLQQEENDEW